MEAWANAGKIVIVSALDGDFRRKPFKNVLQLIPLAEDVTKKSAVCNGCRGKASFTFRLTSETTLEVCGDRMHLTCVASPPVPVRFVQLASLDNQRKLARGAYIYISIFASVTKRC